jgi:hypothetical protein
MILGGFMTHSEGLFTIERGSKGQIEIWSEGSCDRVADINPVNRNAEGNAHLLAASHDLYISLQAMVGLVESIIENDPVKLYKSDRESIKLAKIAISSAKGEGV